MNRILGVVTAVFLLSISITPSAFGEDYTWHLSYSSSDPNVHTQAPVPSPGQFKVYLWLKYTGADGMSAAELGIQYSGYFGHSFTPLNGVLNAGNADNLLLAVGGCPMGPFLAGSFGDYIDLDGGGGMLCIGNTTEFAMRLNDNISIQTFFDAGNVWTGPGAVNPSQLFRGAGMGIQLVTPFGPIGLDYAYGFDKTEPGWQLHFKMGPGF